MKLSNIPYATYGTPEIRTFMVWVLYMEVGRAYIIAKGRGIASKPALVLHKQVVHSCMSCCEKVKLSTKCKTRNML